MTISNIPAGKMLAASFSATLAFALSLNVACSAESRRAIDPSTALTQAYVWYDGEREQRVWLNPRIVAEFGPDAKGESVMRSAASGARILPTRHKQAAVRLWQLDDAAETAIRNLKASHPQGNYSAVFHDGPTGTGRMRALPAVERGGGERLAERAQARGREKTGNRAEHLRHQNRPGSGSARTRQCPGSIGRSEGGVPRLVAGSRNPLV
jgi:hypothetical protein